MVGGEQAAPEVPDDMALLDFGDDAAMFSVSVHPGHDLGERVADEIVGPAVQDVLSGTGSADHDAISVKRAKQCRDRKFGQGLFHLRSYELRI